MNTNYIDELNESQCAAVTYNDGPSLVIAGAGSGKTRVLTYKIAYLLEQENGYNPWNILALTFTNKAAREMKERIARQVGMERARYLWMGTFHSIFSRILRAEAQYIGFTSQFTIYDTADSKSLLRSIIIRSDIQPQDLVCIFTLGSQQNNRNITLLTYLNHCRDSIHLWHHNIHQHQMNILFRQIFQRLTPIPSLIYLITLCHQIYFQC